MAAVLPPLILNQALTRSTVKRLTAWMKEATEAIADDVLVARVDAALVLSRNQALERGVGELKAWLAAVYELDKEGKVHWERACTAIDAFEEEADAINSALNSHQYNLMTDEQIIEGLAKIETIVKTTKPPEEEP